MPSRARQRPHAPKSAEGSRMNPPLPPLKRHDECQSLQQKQLSISSAQTTGGVCARTNSVVGASICNECHAEIEGFSEPLKCFWCAEFLCWKCWERTRGQCVACARTINGSVAAAALAKMRKVRRGGRPRVLRRCPECKDYFPAREMRTHRRAECQQRRGVREELAKVAS